MRSVLAATVHLHIHTSVAKQNTSVWLLPAHMWPDLLFNQVHVNIDVIQISTLKIPYRFTFEVIHIYHQDYMKIC